MAGNGGFKNAINGFDKNEVNEYIGNLRKKLQEMEAEIKSNDEKTRAAVKTAEEADSRISEIEKQNAQKVAELEAQVKTERRNADNLQNEIDELKRKLRHAGSGGASSSSGSASSAEAEKRAAEIVDKANATARDIVEKAKQTAHEIISGASGAQGGGVSEDALQSFNAILRDLSKSVTDALNTANKKASEITGAPAAAAPVLDLSAFSAPQADVPAPKAAAPKPEPKAAAVDDIFADLADDSNDMADFGDIKPLDSKTPDHEVVEGFDLSDVGGFITEDPVSEVSPLDTKKTNGAVLDEDFATELLTQTVPSSVLKDQVDDDLFEAVKERDEQFAVQPADEEKDFDMGDPSGGLDAMNALLGQMGAALESAGGGSSSFDLGESEPAADNAASDNPWADLQNQLNAMEETGNFGSGESSAQSDMMDAPVEDPKAPDADDSSIWNFDDDMSAGSPDDDMSADLFGSF